MPPIQMTRAEYEKKYGVKPVFSTSTLDTTPTRVRMTREEYNQIYGPEKKNAITENLNPFSETNVNRLKDIPSDIKESYQGITEAGQTASRSVSDIWKNKNLNLVQKASATLPGVLSGAFNMAGNAALAPVKVFTTDEFEKNVAKKFASAVEGTINADIPMVDKSMTEIYDGMSEDNKFLVSKLFAPIANVVTSTTVAGKGAPVAEQVVKNTVTKVDDVARSLKNTADNFTLRGDEKALRSVVDEIAKVEDKYAPLRKANLYAKDVDGSRTRIAQSGVLEQAVDETGKIDGILASKLYQKMTIDETEGLVRNILVDENATVSLDKIKDLMETTILKSRLEGKDLARALDDIDGELKGLKIRADANGDVPLYKVHDAKISANGGINYLTPANDKIYRKAVARAYKTIVENESKVEVPIDGKTAKIGDINAKLATYLDDVRRLKALDGRLVDKGKLGKYSASITGTGIGMAVGSLGGGLAAAAGGALGGKVASKMVSRSMQKTFQKGVKGGVPEDKLLKAAKLRVPDKKVVAPKDLPKTKEIKETEKLIEKNIRMQKEAIKANDFTLVAKLKDIYTKLVNKLKEQVTLVRENLRNEQGFANFAGGDTPKNYRNKSLNNGLMSSQKKAINPPNNAQTISDTVSPTTKSATKLSTDPKNFKTAEDLTPEYREIETKAFNRISKSEDKLVGQYLSDPKLSGDSGKVVNTDNFRPLFKQDGYAGYNAASVQEPASYLSKRVYTELLSRNPEKYVTFLAGGSGAGKTSAIKNLPGLSKLNEKSAVIVDSNLSSYSSAIKRIEEAEKAGKKVRIEFVYRDPVESFEKGVVTRMLNNPDEMGRLVPSKVVAGNHIDSFNVARRLQDEGHRVVFIDNSRGAGKAKLIKREELEKKVNLPGYEDLTTQFNEIAKKLYDKGQITKEQYEGYIN